MSVEIDRPPLPNPEVEPDTTPSPGGPDPEAAEPDYPEGGDAGGGFGAPDYPDEPEPDFDDDPEYDEEYYGPDDSGGEPDPYQSGQGGNPCIQARHELAEAYRDIEATDQAIDLERERLEQAHRELVECLSGSGRFLYWVRDAEGRWVEVSCKSFLLRSIQRSEQVIEMRQNRLQDLRAELPELEKRVRVECAGQ